MHRPRAYTLAAILMLVYNLIEAIDTIPSLALGAPASSTDAAPFPLVVLNFALAVLGFVSTYGVWRMQKWGVALMIVVAALEILTALPAILFAPLPARLLGVLGVVWSAAIIVLLLRPAPRPTAA